MNTYLAARGKRIRVTNYSPFRGLKGTIVHVHALDDEGENPFCFFLIALDSLRERMWFEYTEIEFLDAPPFPDSP